MAVSKKEKQGTDKEKKTAVAPVAAELRPVGRPPIEFNQEYADLLCEAIASSSRSLAWHVKKFQEQNKSFPKISTVYLWLRTNEEFSKQYGMCKEDQADFLADDMLDIADDNTADVAIGEDGKAYVKGEVIQRSRLRVDTRKWIASKLKPKKYGDKISSEVEVSGTLSVVSLSKEDTAL